MASDQEYQSLLREIHGTVRVLDERTQTILKQAEKTNGRVTKLEDGHDIIAKKQENLAVKVGAIVTISATVLTTFIARIFPS